MKRSLYIKFILLVALIAIPGSMVHAAFGEPLRCLQAVAKCKKAGDNCVKSLKTDGERCDNTYDRSKDRCELYDTKAEKLIPACKQKYDKCLASAKSSTAASREAKIVKCGEKLTACKIQAEKKADNYAISKKKCSDKAKDRKEVCEDRYRTSYPSRMSRCSSRVTSCMSKLGRCL